MRHRHWRSQLFIKIVVLLIALAKAIAILIVACRM